MFQAFDFGTCTSVVMVGCGPLPVTLFHINDRIKIRHLEGLDVDVDAISMARSLVDAMGRSQIEVHCVSGQDFSYSGADAVYIANMVSPKLGVLDRVAASTSAGTMITVREPFALGILFAESVTDAARQDPRLEYVGAGREERGFLSRDVYFRRIS